MRLYIIKFLNVIDIFVSAKYSLEIEDFMKMVRRLGESSNSRNATVTHAASMSREMTRMTGNSSLVHAGGSALAVPTVNSGAATLTMSRLGQSPRRQPVEVSLSLIIPQ